MTTLTRGLAIRCSLFMFRCLLASALCVSVFAQAPAPEPLLITSVTANTIGLSWNDIYSDEDGFRVERYDPSSGTYVTIAVLLPNVTTFLDTGLTPMEVYSYNVVAFNSGGDSFPASTSAQAMPVPAPEPFGVREPTANTIRLQWNDIYDNEDGFRLERYDPSSGTYVTIAILPPNVTIFMDTGLTPMEVYSYNVVAFNSGGDSFPASTSGQAVPIPAPDPLVITETTANTIALSWTDYSNNDPYYDEDGFRVERFDPSSGTFVTIAILPPNVTTFLDTGLTPMEVYSYNVVAFNYGGDSFPASTSAQAVPIAGPDPLVVVDATANTIALSWSDHFNNHPYDEDGFRLERFDPSSGTYVTIAILPPNVTTFLDTGLTPMEVYSYKVVSFNSGGDSFPASTSGQAVPIAGPDPLVVMYTTANTIALSWTDHFNNHPYDEDGFRLERFDPSSGTYVTIAILPPNVTTFLDTGLTPMVVYSYNVVSFNSGGDSSPASASAETVPVASPGPLLITSITANTIGLAWSDNYSDEDGYRIRRYDSASGNFGEVAILGANVTTFRDTGLTPGVTYYYEVVAFNSGGESSPANASAQATPVPAPDPLTLTASTATTISLAWNDIYNDEDGFRLERSEDGVNFGMVQLLSANETNFVDTGLAPESVYYYRVAAFNSGGDSYYSATVSAGAAPGAAPDPLVVGAISATQITLSWNDIYSDEDGFRLERSTDSIVFTPVVTLPANTTNHVDANLLPNAFYAYRVAGFNSRGDSYYSMTVNATTLPLPPFPPSGLVARPGPTSEIRLTWADNSNNETAFEIERSTDGLNFNLIATVLAGTTSYSDTGLAESTQYHYRVRAKNAGGNSGYSNQASGTTLASTPPSTPSNLTLQAVSSSQINLSWQDNAGNETLYFVERATGNGPFAQIAQISANSQSYSATGLSPNTRYTFRVRCANNAGYSGYSNTPNIKTLK
jgi:fibronectin type 3 domain-containing protein